MALDREKLFEESELLYDLEETKEIVADMHLQDKLFQRYQRRFDSEKGLKANDILDQTPLYTPSDSEFGTPYELLTFTKH